MTAPDPKWVEVGARALVAGKSYGGWIHDEDAWRAATGIAEKVIAAVEPLIRAAVTAETLDFCCEDTRPQIKREVREQVLADLRAKVEGLGHWLDCEAYEDLNEGSDYGNESIRETGEPCSCLIGEFLDLIDKEADRG